LEDLQVQNTEVDEIKNFYFSVLNLLNRYAKLKKGPPKSEYVSDKEIYLLTDTGGRKRKICGAKLKGLPKQFVCSNPAGAKTEHLGIGRCGYHERLGSGDVLQSRLNNLWSLLNTEKGMPSNLSEMIEHAKNIETKIMESVDPDIKILYSLLGFVLNKENRMQGVELTLADISQAERIVEKIAKIKYMRNQMEKETKLDTQTITTFVKTVFFEIRKFVTDQTAHQILASIMQNAVKPYKDENMSIQDAEFEIVDETKIVKSQLEKLIPRL
jgi:hypothetical protein